MSQTNPATRTSRRYKESSLDADSLFDLLTQFNDLVEDTHDFCALLDADAGVTDVNYEAQLTAAQIAFSGYTTAVASPAPVKSLFGTFPLAVKEELAQAATEQISALAADYDTIVAKLNADAGIVAANFDVARITGNKLHERLTTANAGVAQDSINAILQISGRGHGHAGILLAVGTPDTGLAAQIMRSVDDGRTWTPWGALPVAVTVVSALVQRGEKLILVGNTAAAGAIYESDDFGATWSAIAHGLTITSVAFTDAIVLPTGTLLVSGDAAGEVLRSTDGGSTWNLVTVTGPTTVNSLGYESGGKVMACGDDAKLYSASDDGVTFALEEDFSLGNPTDCRYFLELANGYWAVTTWVAAGTDELQISQDSGATWEAPVAVTGAQTELNKMIQAVDGILYIAVGADAQYSDDNGATVELVANGIVFPANDTAIAAFCRNRKGEVVVGSTNATDAAGLWIMGVRAPQLASAFGVTDLTGGPILAQNGQGPDAKWAGWLRECYERCLQEWQTLGAFCDDDATIATATYEAAIATSFLSVARAVPEAHQHNVGHGAAA